MQGDRTSLQLFLSFESIPTNYLYGTFCFTIFFNIHYTVYCNNFLAIYVYWYVGLHLRYIGVVSNDIKIRCFILSTEVTLFL